MVQYRNPMTIVASDAGTTDPAVKITNYDTTSGVIQGVNFGTTSGTVYLLNRDTHTYTSLSTSGWGDTSIALTNPIDLSTIEGNTCFFIRTSKGANSNKYMVYGTIAVPQYGLIYYKNYDTGVVSKITMTASGDLGALQGAASAYGKSTIVNNVTFHTSQIVGVQFGSSISNYVMPSYFMAGLLNLDQPIVIPTSMVTAGTSTYFMFNCRSFNCPVVFTSSTNHIRCPDYFMSRCQAFNQPLDLSYSKNIFGNFMANCSAFNSEIKFASTLTTTTLGNYFMFGCSAFNQPITWPTNITGVGTYFMAYCYAFNQPLPNFSNFTGSSAIGTYFLEYCYAFNQPIDLSNIGTSFTSIPNYFLTYCRGFNSPIKLRSTITAIGTYFIAGTSGSTSTTGNYGNSFNQPLDLSNVTTIGNYFLYCCFAFNSTVTISKITSIGSYFMMNCTSFAQPLTIPSTATSIGASFMLNCLQARTMTINTTSTPSAKTCLTVATVNTTTPANNNAPAVAIGIKLYGTGRTTWINYLPNSTTSPWRTLIDGGS